jgi:ferredoxin
MAESVQALFFSPTGGTQKILSTIAKSMDLDEKPSIDLTLRKSREAFTGEVVGDIVLVGSPVYAGTIPYPFLESLVHLDGRGKWAVPIAVYGNRSADSMIEEMVKVLREDGFNILAAATFISKHSYAVQDHPWGVGRPDEKDLTIAAEFGRRVAEKVRSDRTEITVSNKLSARWWGFLTPDPSHGDQIVEVLPEGYHKRVVDRIKWMWTIDSSQRGECTQCGICANSCPTSALDGDTLEIDEDLCLRCAACVDRCPNNVMKLVFSDKPDAKKIFAGIDKAMEARKEPEMFV